MKIRTTFWFVMVLFLCVACLREEQTAETTSAAVNDNSVVHSIMNNERMHNLLQRIDPELQGQLYYQILHK